MTPAEINTAVAELLLQFPDDSLFSSTSGQPFVRLPHANQSFPLDSPILHHWLRDRFFRRTSHPIPPRALTQILTTLRSLAHCNPIRRPVALRSGGTPTTISIDLANNKFEFLEIDAQGWRVTTLPELTFQSARGQLPLPTPEIPERSETPEYPETPESKPPNQITQWLIRALQPHGPYPILILHGPPGTGKSTLARAIRALIDPVTAPLLALPSRARAIENLALGHRLLVFDHVTRMSPTAADALCRISSGTGIEAPDGARLDIARPIVITTPRLDCHDWQPRADLAARAIAIDVTIADATLPAPAALYSSLFTPTNLETGCAAALQQASAQADPLFAPIKSLVDSHQKWSGSATDLQNEICVTLSNPRALSHRLMQLTPALNAIGIEVCHQRLHGGIRQLTLTNRQPPVPTNHPKSDSGFRIPHGIRTSGRAGAKENLDTAVLAASMPVQSNYNRPKP